MKSIVLASSKGIGKSIADNLPGEVIRTDSKLLDTSDINSVQKFVREQAFTDVLVLNTGGPPAKNFFEIKASEWEKYYNQLFYGFVYILQNLTIKEDGYIFLISSHQIKEPDTNMALSVTYRSAISSLLKLLTPVFAKKNISCINIAPGPIGTDRLRSLVKDIKELESRLPLGRVGDPQEIADFITSIIEKKIKYLTGVTINFDGGLNKYVY